MTAFDHDALFNKSKVFIARSVEFRASGESELCQLWASLSLELLAKAALASIHASLVADPSNIDSLFAACGRPYSSIRKSIAAKTVFERMKHVSNEFLKDEESFCVEMASRRNSELHSGELPFSAMRDHAWVPRYWRVCQIILKSQGKTLSDWVAASTVVAAEEAIKSLRTAEVVSRKVSEAIKVFNERYPSDPDKKTVRSAKKGAAVNLPALFGHANADVIDYQVCPACECRGYVSGERWGDEYVSPEDHDEPWKEFVDVQYMNSSFRCVECDLRLDGQDELRVAELPLSCVLREERDVDYEPEYGNE